MSVGEGPRDPEELEASGAPIASTLPARTALGDVHLTVSELERSLAFYQRAIGLELLERGAGGARLGVSGHGLLALVEHAGARPAAGHTGLYHFALLLSQRAELARWLAHAARDRVSLAGLSDHFVSEALYLSDPDGHGIEIYWDRPRELWEGRVATRMTTQPLDVNGLLSALEGPDSGDYPGLPADTIMGHVHLKVAAIAQTVGFYRDALGFGLMAQLGAQAAFLGAGGYHHHIGANTWESAGAAPPPPGSAALRRTTVVLPSESEREGVLARLAHRGYSLLDSGEGPLVRDPSGNALVLALA
jgi:catechol 2,3-dioxygenase